VRPRLIVMILLMLLPATAAHARPWASSAEAAGFEVSESKAAEKRARKSSDHAGE
jgi:hypothetical protein